MPQFTVKLCQQIRLLIIKMLLEVPQKIFGGQHAVSGLSLATFVTYKALNSNKVDVHRPNVASVLDTAGLTSENL